MFDWLVVRAEHRPLLGPALGRAWQGQALLTDMGFARKQLVFVDAGESTARRAARWPDVLVEWAEIYDEKLFVDERLPVLAEEVSGLGADALVAHAEPGFARATVAWYEKGALREYERVGAAQVAWSPDHGLGRPFDGSSGGIAAVGGRYLAAMAGAERSASLLDRLQSTRLAAAEAVLARAFLLMLDDDPPAMDDLAGLVARAPAARFDCH